jgi:4-alpha-glucanotransferase
VGAPADAFNQQGQDWSQPPWRPDRLAEVGYRPYRDMLRTVLRHAGGLRVDHVLGLFRLWWVPAGLPPSAGTYVRYDHEAMVGILALEAYRAGAFVVGEDLGTVEPWVRDYLRDRGIAGTSVLWFERDWDRDVPIRPERWRSLCLATVTTHDLPPTAGYLAGEHVRLRSELGLLTRPVEEVAARDVAEQESWRCSASWACCARGRTCARPSRRCTGSWPGHRRSWSGSPSPTRRATCGRRTSRAPTTSTPTGGCRCAARTARRCCSSSW